MRRRTRASAPASRGITEARLGVPLRLAGVSVTGAERLRLAELGLRVGAVLTVLSRTTGGGRLIGIGTGRIAVDRSTARALEAELA